MSLSDKRIGGSYELLYSLQVLSEFKTDVNSVHRGPEYAAVLSVGSAESNFFRTQPASRREERSRHIRLSLQCPIQLLGGREHQPNEQRWFRCGRAMQCSGLYDSKLQRTRNSPGGRLKRKHTVTEAVQLCKRFAKHRAEHSQGDLGRRRYLRRPTPIRLPSSEPELLWGNRKGRLDRESSMGQRPAIRHVLLIPCNLALRCSA